MFGAVAKAGTDISALIRRNLGVVGRTDATLVTAFTDGCPGLRSVLVGAGVTTPPILDWFHIAMRFQHATQAASSLSADNPSRVQAKAVIVEEVERLRWRSDGRPRLVLGPSSRGGITWCSTRCARGSPGRKDLCDGADLENTVAIQRPLIRGT